MLDMRTMKGTSKYRSLRFASPLLSSPVLIKLTQYVRSCLYDLVVEQTSEQTSSVRDDLLDD